MKNYNYMSFHSACYPHLLFFIQNASVTVTMTLSGYHPVTLGFLADLFIK